MQIFIAKYDDGMYPEDNQTLGAYTTSILAEEAIEKEIDLQKSLYPNHPNKNTRKRWYYSIEELELHGEK